jgi:hypothetical protein
LVENLFRSGSGTGRFQKSYPDPTKNRPDPQHCLKRLKIIILIFCLFVQADTLLARYLQLSTKEEDAIAAALSSTSTNGKAAATVPANDNGGNSNGNVEDDFDIERLDLSNMDATRSVIQEQARVLAQLRSDQRRKLIPVTSVADPDDQP